MLDERTILLMMAALISLMAMVSGGLRAGHPDLMRGLGSWAWALLLYAISATFAGLWIGAPYGPRLLVSNFFFVSAVSLLGFSVLRFFDVPLRPRRWVGVAAAIYLFAAFFTQHAEQSPLRISLFSLQTVVVAVLAAYFVVLHGTVRRSLGAQLLLLALVMVGAGSALRLAAAITGFSPVTLLSGSARSVIWIFLTLNSLGLVLGTMGLILLASERLRLRLEELALRDSLTGLLIRRGFSALSEQIIASAKREKQWLGFLICDIDLFKAINDRYGHQAGDAVLLAVAHTLREQARGVDLVSRFGGEEFAILLPNSDPTQTRKAAERLRVKVEALVVPHAGQSLTATISIGAVAMLADSASIEAMYRAADEALYRAKANGRNRVEVA